MQLAEPDPNITNTSVEDDPVALILDLRVPIMARISLLSVLFVAASVISVHEGADYHFAGNDAINHIADTNIPSPNLPGGWYASGQCASGYCVYANPSASGGTGIAVITTTSSVEKLKALQRRLGVTDTFDIPDPPPYEIRDVPGKGKVLVATEPIKRGTKLLSNEPVMVVHRDFVSETFSEKQTFLVETAVRLLPAETQKRIYAQINPANGIFTLKDVVQRRPFNVNLGLVWTGANGYEGEKHLVNFSGATTLPHHCRPNAAFYIDGNLVQHVSAVRKIQPGEEISISYFNPFLTTADRRANTEKWFGKACACDACTKGGDLDQILASDARLEEIRTIESRLRDLNSKITTGTLARLVQLYQEEGLESRMAEMYGQVAIGYNSLGYQKRAIKYANLAVQAGIIQDGPGSNDVIAMRILAKSTMEHYSWGERLKGKG